MLETLKGYVLYAAKAAVAAITPIVIALIDTLALELSNAVQVTLTAAATAVAVYFVKNAAAPEG